MYDQLPIILQLQEIDGEIDKLESEKKKIPIELQALEAELARHRERFQLESDKLEELKRERRSKERQLSVQQDKLEQYESQRLSVRTNKEYTALESEIADLEESNSAIEDEILELMISIDEATDEIEGAKNELDAQEDKFKRRREKLLSDLRGLDRQIAGWNGKRGDFLKKISPVLMRKYDNWRKRRGSSLVAVIHGQTCGGCHLTLPLQLINEVREKKKIYTCNSCGRILYWEEKSENSESEE